MHAGLRLGEATALKWEDVHWGKDEDDTSRHLWVCRSQSRGGPDGLTKTGKSRKVALAGVLRRVLRAEWQRPGRDPVYVARYDHTNWRRREFARYCRTAELHDRRVKDLRSTFASTLVTAGVPLPYVSRQLGHASLGTTSQFYATYAGEEFIPPLPLDSGEVPADLVCAIATIIATIEEERGGLAT